MSRHAEQAPPPADYKGRDISYRGLVYAFIGLVVLLGVAAGATFLLFDFFQIRQAAGDPPASPFGEVRLVPPEPRLQVEPIEDLRAMEAETDRLLGGYAWVDRERGLVRIPIERAMEIVAERGAGGGGAPEGVSPGGVSQ